MKAYMRKMVILLKFCRNWCTEDIFFVQSAYHLIMTMHFLKGKDGEQGELSGSESKGGWAVSFSFLNKEIKGAKPKTNKYY